MVNGDTVEAIRVGFGCIVQDCGFELLSLPEENAVVSNDARWPTEVSGLAPQDSSTLSICCMLLKQGQARYVRPRFIMRCKDDGRMNRILRFRRETKVPIHRSDKG